MKLTVEHLKELIREAIAKEQVRPKSLRPKRNSPNAVLRILQILQSSGPTEARDLPPHLLLVAGVSTLKKAEHMQLVSLVPGTEYATYQITPRGMRVLEKQTLKEQAAVQEASREAERNFMRAQAKLDREQPIPVPSSWENDALGNTTLFLSLGETLRSYNIAEVGTDRSRQNVFIQFTPKGKEK